MNKISRVLGATLGASAILGTSAVAANAHGFGGHDGGHSAHGAQHSSAYAKTGPYSLRGAHHQFSHYAQGRDHQGTFVVGKNFNHQWFKHHWGHHRHHLSFAQEQARIVAKLTKADTRLSALITKVSAAAQQNPNGWAAKALPYLQQEQTKLESLITAVKAATNQQELAAAFKAAFTPPTTSTPAPTQPPSAPAPTQQPSAPSTPAAPSQDPTSSAPTSSAPTTAPTSSTAPAA